MTQETNDNGEPASEAAANFPDLFCTPEKSRGKSNNETQQQKSLSQNPKDHEARLCHASGSSAQDTTENIRSSGTLGETVEPPNIDDERANQNLHPTSVVNQNTQVASSSLREKVRPGISKRTDFPLVRDKVALLIIDVQSYLSESSGVGFFHDSVTTMCGNIPKLMQAFRTYRDTQDQGCEVIFTFLQALTTDRRDISFDYKLSGPSLANIPTVNTPQEELFLDSIMPEIKRGKGDILIPKTSCSVFQSTNLDYVLRNLHVQQLVMCGQLTDQCVESAVRDAADLGYFVTVVTDACAAQSKEAEAKGFHGMAGFCRFIPTESVVQELAAPSKDQLIASTPSICGAARDSGTLQVLPPKDQSLAHRSFIPPKEEAYTLAVLHSLKAAGVEFLRYLVVDVCNTVRCKAVPLDHLLRKSSLNYQVSLATVVVAGLPSFADAVMPGTGLDASGVMIVQPDVSTLRVLPYSPKSALVLGNIHDPRRGGTLSELCTRGLLERICRTSREEFGIEFCVGAEVEFCLYDAKTGKPVDESIFCNSTTLNQQDTFISDLYNHLKEQRIPIEMIHAESASGQLEVVITYQQNPVMLVDHVVLCRETIIAVSRAHSLKAVFLPKPIQQQAGNGLHLHLSFNNTETGKNGFAANGGLSDKGQSFVEGILEHFGALLALTLPTTNSFRRIGPGCWTGSDSTWEVEDKESALRVCSNLHSQEWEHVEYKLNDCSGNLYLGLAGVLACGLDGIRRRVVLRPSKQSSNAHPENTKLPGSLEESLDSLGQDKLLMQLMGPTLSQSYVALRRAEAKRSSDMSLEDEVREALNKA